MYELIPDELKLIPNWVCWRADPDPNSHSGISKKPVNPKTGGLAQSNNPETWGTFEEATMRAPEYAGIGFMFSNSEYFGVDIDDIPAEVAEYKEYDCDNIVSEFADQLQTYVEESQSGNGVHMICRGSLPSGKRRRGKIEMYDSGRFFVMTGRSISKYSTISDCTETIRPLHTKFLGDAQPDQREAPAPKVNSLMFTDEEIIDKATAAKNGYDFSQLYYGHWEGMYPSQSEADIAFANMLAFWCQRDTVQMDRIFRNSGLMRDKYNRRIGDSTYGETTIQRAARDCRDVYTPSEADDYYITIKPKTPDEYNCVILHKRYTLDDTGNANMLYDACDGAFMYSYTDKKWLYYNGGKWSYDATGEIYKTIDAAIAQMSTLDDLYAPTLDPEDEGYKDQEKIFDAWVKHKKKSRSHSSKSATEKELQYRVSVEPKDLDAHPDIVNFRNCTLNLRTMQTTDHCISDNITKIIDIDYLPAAAAPKKWLQFLDDIFGDAELISYIQKACGYCLSGSTAEQCVFFLFGNGRNGKSTFLEVVRGILGEYATNVQPSTIMVKKSGGSGANSDIARLKGARLVTSVEPNEGDRLDEGLIKQITGGDVVTARKLYGEEFEFCPEFKLWMATNHKPLIRGRDMGIWRRIHLIPFTVTIPDEKVDRDLKVKLAAEKESILKWMVDGYIRWVKEGLQLPPCMVNATNEYKHEMDSIASFIDACCVVEEGATVGATEIFTAYNRWAKEFNEYEMSSTKFGRELNKKFNKYKDGRGCMVYRGLRIGDKPNDYCITIGNN